MNFFKPVTHFFAHLKSLFLSGLFTMIPIAATLFFINFAYHLVSRIILPLRTLEPAFLQQVPGSEFVLVMLMIVVFGILLKIFIAHTVLHYLEYLIVKIPLVRIIYSSSKILVDFFKLSDKKKAMERKVVLIHYPRKGQFHLAFLLESAEQTYQKLIPEHQRYATPDEKFYKVFMPHSPNPTTGFFFILPESDIIHTDISFEEAIKTLISCGLTTPESIKPISDVHHR
ncbi:MAG: DUF502 domain-containing protein [Candidatus Babeliales bacterium]